jgi:hypothetical protein
MMSCATRAVPGASVWLGRVRFVVATGLLWAGLHFLAGGLVLPRGLDRALVLSGSPAGPLAGLLVIVLAWVGSGAATLILGARDTRRPLIVLGLALALWAAEGGRQGGTIGSWLIFCNETPGPPRSAPYWLLLPDYVYLLIAVAGAYAIAAALAARQAGQATVQQALGRAFGQKASVSERRQGVVALVTASLTTGLAMLLLTGPADGPTLRGQVYFAVGIGTFAGVFVARRIVSIRDPIWFWPAPFLVGVVGLVAAGLKPDLRLPSGYELDTIPAWGLVRALPIEMVGVGLVGTLWTLRVRGADRRQDAGG